MYILPPHEHERHDEAEDADEDVGEGQLVAGAVQPVAAVVPVEHQRLLQPTLVNKKYVRV